MILKINNSSLTMAWSTPKLPATKNNYVQPYTDITLLLQRYLTTLNLVCGNFLYVMFLVFVQKTLCLVLARSKQPLKNFSRKKIFLFLRLTNSFRRLRRLQSVPLRGLRLIPSAPSEPTPASSPRLLRSLRRPLPSAPSVPVPHPLCSFGAIPTVPSAAIAGMVWSYNGQEQQMIIMDRSSIN